MLIRRIREKGLINKESVGYLLRLSYKTNVFLVKNKKTASKNYSKIRETSHEEIHSKNVIFKSFKYKNVNKNLTMTLI